MPKRLNPFGNSHLQLKTHISEKEVNLGVNQNENMKAIYDKTLKLLFRGAHIASKSNNEIPSNGHHSKDESINNVVAHCNGSAVHSNGVVKDDKITDSMNIKTCCKRNIKSRCSFCESCICIECQRLCFCCEEIFCQVCSVMRYQETDVMALCLSCVNS